MSHQFSGLEKVFSLEAFISSDAYLEHALDCERCLYYRSDAIFRKRTWRGRNVQALVGRSNKKRANLILGHSDQYTGLARVLILRKLGYSKVCGINVRRVSGVSFPIPIGITNNTNESEYHRLFGNNKHFMLANQEKFLEGSNGRVYGCFSTGTNIRERVPLANLLADGNHTFEEPEFSEAGRIRYLQNLRKYAFTVCPIGNGIDTHRLWEVLYMGGVPIIRRNEILESLLEDLPYVLVDQWNQINDEAFLQASWDELSNRRDFNFDKLTVGYWIDRIHAD